LGSGRELLAAASVVDQRDVGVELAGQVVEQPTADRRWPSIWRTPRRGRSPTA
jgi:hypothetical protein